MELLNSVELLPFETLERSSRSDWFGLSLLFTGLALLILLQYRNPNTLISIVTRIFKNDADKLYFNAPPLDFFDRLLLTVIYFVGATLCVHSILKFNIEVFGQLAFYTLPIALPLFFVLPLIVLGNLSGHTKEIRVILKKQLPLIYLLGILLLFIGALFFMEDVNLFSSNVLILNLLLILLLVLHFRVIRSLILVGFSVNYIFMYICTFEILPAAFFWTLISRF